ncbi:hypothetical protein CRYUN_Cryun26dG0034300 [Craigia yunnanensis]
MVSSVQLGLATGRYCFGSLAKSEQEISPNGLCVNGYAGDFCNPEKGSPTKLRILHQAFASKAIEGCYLYKPKSRARLQVQASFKEKAVTGLTAAALTASMIIPEVAEAAESGVSPSLKNFLLSIVAGGVVLSAIVGAVVGVANFDTVKRT